MALFVSLWNSRHAFQPQYVERQRDAEIDRDRITRAAVTIQAIRRGCLKRRQVKLMRAACTALQRVWRGFLGRETAAYDSALRDKERAKMLWSISARAIQRTFRGFRSRRYKHSHYERKAYLAAVRAKDQNMREVSISFKEQTERERAELLQTKQRAEFEALAADLHHLRSTSHIPGVFNSPYVEPLTAFGVPMEQHLQDNFKKSKFCSQHMRRAMGADAYARSYKKTGQTTLGYSTASSTYQYASMPRPLDNAASYTLDNRKSLQQLTKE